MAKDSVPLQLLDKRVVERNVKKGLLTREQVEKHLSSLHDVAAQSELIRAKLGEEPVDDEAGDDGDEDENS